MTTLHMDGPISGSQSKEQTTRAVFVIWIVFDDCSTRDGFAYFLNSNFPQNRLVGRVFGKLKLVFGEFGANLYK